MKGKSDDTIKAHIFGLTVACPYTGDNPNDCPLCEIRHLPLSEREAWVKDLTDEECRSYYQYHNLCLSKKEHNS